MIYAEHELFELKPCKILHGERGKKRWKQGANAIFQVDNLINFKRQKHWVVKYQGKKLLLSDDEVKIS